MKRKLLTSLLSLSVGIACFSQSSNFPPDSKPAETNAPGVEYPRIDSQNRAIFKLKAPNAQIVQLDLGKVYDMTKAEDGTWTVTTQPLPPGFHYTYYVSKGTAHEWLTWGRCLYEFAPLLFN